MENLLRSESEMEKPDLRVLWTAVYTKHFLAVHKSLPPCLSIPEDQAAAPYFVSPESRNGFCGFLFHEDRVILSFPFHTDTDACVVSFQDVLEEPLNDP